MRCADELTVSSSRDGGARAVRLLASAALDPTDQLTAIAAVHALARIFDDAADDVLVPLLTHESGFLREHAAWAFGVRLPRLDAVAGLVRMVIDGGFAGMVAQRTLEQWSASTADSVALALEAALLGIRESGARARLVETIGLVPGRIPERMLRQVAVDFAEPLEARAAAVAALGDRDADETNIRLVTDLSFEEGELASVARLALYDLTAARHPRPPWSHGTTIAQLFLHADIDGELSRVGSGDNGGIATLLVRLGDALVAGHRASGVDFNSRSDLNATEQVERVITLSRGTHATAFAALPEVASTLSGHAFAAIPFLGDVVPAAEAWPRRIATERGIRRVLRAAGTVDAIHLRMADVGSLAAATVARELDIPIVFTVAPDPHAVIDSMERSGALTRAQFGKVDEVEHFWFRARLVQRLAADAAHTVFFPRPDLEKDMRDLVGIDVNAHPERHTVVAEGIDLTVIERSLAEVLTPRQGAPTSPALTELDDLLRRLPEERRDLPLLISVGRLHRVKGMASLVEAWAADPTLHGRSNLIIVGGDLEHPSSDEQEQLRRMDAVIPLSGAVNHGLILAGHRANDTVARWLVAARFGRPGLSAPHGVYVCASVKEEFGLALLEAMATGLPVVAPDAGGPATYVEQGVTGFLVDTGSSSALAGAVSEALEVAIGPFGPEYAERGRNMVARSFTIQAMARSLTNVYRDVADAAETATWALNAS
ncbi:glycosyltransferase [Cryobacterium sp. CG_9.6]|uniref:glycosyltransferase n=1 Tax=Cryobacterium sp. CG_9.6 TaxID=2760710 RepID=UPI0024763038|nr:glycosyltransferase [Cryobacterium sp. CG_9.6]MDH6236847.1 glycosyltransferase involved in cell wall biosynthesis [Cryobacterium sp. CG_9.6]